MEVDEIRYSVQNVSKVIRFSEVQSEKLIDSVVEQTKDMTRCECAVLMFLCDRSTLRNTF